LQINGSDVDDDMSACVVLRYI